MDCWMKNEIKFNFINKLFLFQAARDLGRKTKRNPTN